MSEQNKTYKIEKFDFGLNSSDNEGSSSVKHPLEPSSHKIKLTDILTFVKKALLAFYQFLKLAHVTFCRVKWKVSRSIFLGRGIYFKYISNLSILIIVAFGTFVYMGHSNVPGKENFFSKYSNIASANDSVLDSPGGQTVLDQKQSEMVKYTVNGGDTLSSIAHKFSTSDNAISIDSILWANNMNSTDVLRPGMVLNIPPVSGVSHTIQPGENLVQIAKKYGKIDKDSSIEEITGATQEIADFNLLDIKVEGDDKIPVLIAGQNIFIPGGEKISTPSTLPPVARSTPTPTRTPRPAPPAPNNPPVATDAKFIWPVASGGIISQRFSSYHRAVDIADRSGPNLLAIADGTIIRQGWESGGGGFVVHIQFDNGWGAEYAHMMGGTYRFPGAGSKVQQGQVLGRMGSTGNSTGTHVHFMLFPPNNPVNPNGRGAVDPVSVIRR